MASDYTEDELETLAQAAYGRRRVRCTRCDGPVRYHETGSLGRTTVPLIFACERCRAHGEYSPDHFEAMALEWTREEKVRIVERYWAHGRTWCPNDDAILKIARDDSYGDRRTDVHFNCPHCGRSFWSSNLEDDPDPDSFSARYEEIRQISEGGMGTVHLVKERKTGMHWAAKRILPKLIKNEEVVRRFQRESRILEKLDHPNVVRIRETSLDDRGAIVVMDYIPGGNLAKAINEKSIDSTILLRYFGDIVEGLTYLHGQGIIHRDLKPSNVLVDTDPDRARISDFGLARLVRRDSTPLTEEGYFLGTPRYAAPEQISGARDVTAKCDIYALGVIAYEIAIRKSPYVGPINVSKFAPDLQNAITCCLGEDPNDRPPSGDFLRESLKGWLGSGGD